MIDTLEERLLLAEQYIIGEVRTGQYAINDIIDLLHWIKDGNNDQRSPVLVRELQKLAKDKDLPVTDYLKDENKTTRVVTLLRSLDLNRMESELSAALGPNSEWVADIKELKGYLVS